MKILVSSRSLAAMLVFWSSLLISAADAQDATQPPEQQTGKPERQSVQKDQLEEIVVTGVARSSGERKQDASFSITTISADQIDEIAPNGTASLMSVVPGLWVESSGGEAGANIFVRGFPGGGDAEFVTVQLDGSPIF